MGAIHHIQDRETSGATETNYRYWNLKNAMVGGGKIE